jgi:hypothetical protein
MITMNTMNPIGIRNPIRNRNKILYFVYFVFCILYIIKIKIKLVFLFIKGGLYIYKKLKQKTQFIQ